MERRNWSLNALQELVYIDSLDDEQRALGLSNWTSKYLIDNKIFQFDLEHKDLLRLSEFMYKNMEFLKNHKSNISISMIDNQKIKQFIQSKI